MEQRPRLRPRSYEPGVDLRLVHSPVVVAYIAVKNYGTTASASSMEIDGGNVQINHSHHRLFCA